MKNIKNIFITGAQFGNKGAQSLLFSTICQLKKVYPDAEFYYYPIDNSEKYNKKLYKFHIVGKTSYSQKYEDSVIFRLLLNFCGIFAKIFKKDKAIKRTRELHNTIKNMDLMVDVSGYQLGSKWSYKINNRFLHWIENAKRYNIPVVLMPQSFGPFDYGSNQKKMDKRIRKTLEKVDLIYAREDEGAKLLREKYGLKQVRQCCDLVLQNDKECDLSMIYYDVPENKIINLKTKNNVAIIPNFQTVEHGNSESVLLAYEELINQLTEWGKNVVIFRHSKDLELCKKIYNQIKIRKEQVQLIEREFECTEYSEFVNQFGYIVASRFHAVLHAYQQGVPCLVLGWSVKYMELAKLFNQEQYVIDITNQKDNKNLMECLFKLESNYLQEKETIIKLAQKLPKHKCVNEIKEYLEQ